MAITYTSHIINLGFWAKAKHGNLQKKLLRYKDKVFVFGGYDKETETYPFLTEVGSFLSHSRSIFQYAYKEADERNKRRDYDDFVSKTPIIGLFKGLRDTEIHDSTIGTHTLIDDESRIDIDNDQPESQKEKERVNKEKQARVLISLTRKLKITPEILDKFQKEGRKDLTDAATKGESLYEAVELNGESDIFKLFEMYIAATEKFIEYGVKKGFIT